MGNKKKKGMARVYFHFIRHEDALKAIEVWWLKQDPSGKKRSIFDMRTNSRGTNLYLQDKYLSDQKGFKKFLKVSPMFKGKVTFHTELYLLGPLDEMLDRVFDEMD